MRFITILTMFLSFSSFAEDLTIESAEFGCTEQKKDANNDPFKYKYGVVLYIKNTGVKNVTLLTKINTLSSIPTGTNDNSKVKRILSYGGTMRDGSTIIIPKEKLELVELFPGDLTMLSYQFSDKKFIDKSSFEYSASAVYGGRFNNWVGTLQTEEVKTQILYKCKT